MNIIKKQPPDKKNELHFFFLSLENVAITFNNICSLFNLKQFMKLSKFYILFLLLFTVVY